jgi:pyruvate/2-oxoglutarate dehydrogenase complex dihydrolipoamide dehydrogenase (E3) component
VAAHVRGVIDTIAPIDSQERFEGLGVRVVRERARFVDRRTVASASLAVKARLVVIATGGRAAPPPIPGLSETPYLTNETIFDLPVLPGHLIVLGAGAIGLELGQAFRRLGSDVTIIEAQTLFAGSDEDAAQELRTSLRSEGLTLHESARAGRVEPTSSGGVRITVEAATGSDTIEGTHLLVATGRRANVEDIGLEVAGVAYDAKGVKTDAYLRTSNKRVYALGDVAAREQFTHVAGMHGSVFIRNALFRLSPGRADALPIPRVVYTDPEYAVIGMTEADARAAHGDRVRVLRTPLHENDRAQTERDTDGFARLIVKNDGTLLGGAILGAHAGETIATLAVALSHRLKVSALSSAYIPAYPTRAEALKRAAGQFYTGALFSPRTRALVRALAQLP